MPKIRKKMSLKDFLKNVLQKVICAFDSSFELRHGHAHLIGTYEGRDVPTDMDNLPEVVNAIESVRKYMTGRISSKMGQSDKRAPCFVAEHGFRMHGQSDFDRYLTEVGGVAHFLVF